MNMWKTFSQKNISAAGTTAEKSELAVDVGGDLLYYLTQVIGGAKLFFNLIYGVHNRGMILSKFRSGVQEAEIRELPN